MRYHRSHCPSCFRSSSIDNDHTDHPTAGCHASIRCNGIEARRGTGVLSSG
ncbi:MAG: hypothetical protein KDA86_20950 [Planctomycetaceae bacterium]|nr:hypothetical protein [Planctomycetaceae bacterium]MCA9112376.1 hypothetical protein [Planctomycetaceae bacterium]